MELLTKQGEPITDEMLDEWAEMYESGNWPEGKTVILDPALIRDDALKPVTFKLPEYKIDQLDRKASANGETRSEALRKAVDGYLAIA